MKPVISTKTEWVETVFRPDDGRAQVHARDVLASTVLAVDVALELPANPSATAMMLGDTTAIRAPVGYDMFIHGVHFGRVECTRRWRR